MTFWSSRGLSGVVSRIARRRRNFYTVRLLFETAMTTPPSNFRRLVAATLILSTAAMGLPMTAHAGIVSTDAVLSSAATATDLSTTPSAQREQVTAFLQRADVRQALQAQGVQADAAVERVNAMSDAEVAQLAGRIDQAPVGGDVLGMLFTIFIILLVTDILGLTKVFPFTRSVR